MICELITGAEIQMRSWMLSSATGRSVSPRVIIEWRWEEGVSIFSYSAKALRTWEGGDSEWYGVRTNGHADAAVLLTAAEGQGRGTGINDK